METITEIVQNRLESCLAHGAHLQHDEDDLWEVKKKLGIAEICFKKWGRQPFSADEQSRNYANR